jgi:hypothetical protein
MKPAASEFSIDDQILLGHFPSLLSMSQRLFGEDGSPSLQEKLMAASTDLLNARLKVKSFSKSLEFTQREHLQKSAYDPKRPIGSLIRNYNNGVSSVMGDTFITPTEDENSSVSDLCEDQSHVGEEQNEPAMISCKDAPFSLRCLFNLSYLARDTFAFFIDFRELTKFFGEDLEKAKGFINSRAIFSRFEAQCRFPLLFHRNPRHGDTFWGVWAIPPGVLLDRHLLLNSDPRACCGIDPILKVLVEVNHLFSSD